MNDERECRRATLCVVACLESGMPAAAALRLTLHTLPPGDLCSSLDASASALERGEQWSDALAGLPPDLRDSLEFAARLPAPHSALSGLCRHLMAVSVINGIAMGLMLFIMVIVVPLFARVFEDMKIPLPMLTSCVIGASTLLVQFGAPTAAASLLVLGVVYWRHLRGRSRLESMLLLSRMPVVGELILRSAGVRFLESAGALLEAGTPIVLALRAARADLGEHPATQRIREAELQAERGVPFSTTLAESPLIGAGARLQLLAAELSGRLDEAFARLSQEAKGQIDQKGERLTLLMHAIMLIVVGLFMGVIIYALFSVTFI